MQRFLRKGCICFLSVIAVVLVQQASTATEPHGRQSAVQTRPKDNPIPSTFINLQVLPKNISKGELVDIMKQFSITFNVRCSYCHAVSDDLTQGSFDSEEKPAKQKARELMKTLIQVGGSSRLMH
jgi:hypothetical protein